MTTDLLQVKEDDPANPNCPKKNVVQGSGTSYCPSKQNMGTLGVQVDTAPPTGFCFVATYHNFAEDKTDFAWVFNDNGTAATGEEGKVIRRSYTWGKDKKWPLLDCALIQLDSKSQTSVAPGLFQGNDKPAQAVRGTNLAAVGMIVKKFGMTTGLTYGRVINLPLDIDASYSSHLFAVERCDSNGYPMSGKFADAGDSGAPVVDLNGYVLGLVIQSKGFNGGKEALGLINRIDQVQAALNVTIH